LKQAGWGWQSRWKTPLKIIFSAKLCCTLCKYDCKSGTLSTL
jgi:hypothetical protein